MAGSDLKTSPAASRPSDTALVIGYVAGAHGTHGGLRVQLHDARSEALAPGRRVILRRQGEVLGHYEVRIAAPVPGKPARRRVTLHGVDHRDAAEALRGSELVMERDQLPPLSEDEFYLADVIGRPVQRQRDGWLEDLGEVVGLTSNGVQDLLEIEWRAPAGQAETWLLPVVPELLVEVSERRLLVDVPLGMLPDALEDGA